MEARSESVDVPKMFMQKEVVENPDNVTIEFLDFLEETKGLGKMEGEKDDDDGEGEGESDDESDDESAYEVPDNFVDVNEESEDEDDKPISSYQTKNENAQKSDECVVKLEKLDPTMLMKNEEKEDESDDEELFVKKKNDGTRGKRGKYKQEKAQKIEKSLAEQKLCRPRLKCAGRKGLTSKERCVILRNLFFCTLINFKITF